MPRSRVSCVAILVSFLVVNAAFCQGLKEEDPLWQHYGSVVQGSTLELSEAEPFLLKLDYHLYDLDGFSAQSGTAELSWGNGKSTIHIKSQSLEVSEPAAPDAEARTHVRENYLVHQVLSSLSQPLPSVERQDFVMSKYEPKNDPSATGCFALVKASALVRETPAYCTDEDNRLTVLTGPGPFVLRRSTFRKYRNREVPLDIELSYGGKIAITAHVTELDVLQGETSVSSTSAKKATTDPRIPAGIIEGFALKRKNPTYPKDAQKRRLEGTVVLWAIITKEGTIASLDVISSPDSMLSKSATDAVQKWTYKPYLLNGAPVEVETTILVNYAFRF